MDNGNDRKAALKALSEWRASLDAFERAGEDEAKIAALELEAKAQRLALYFGRLREKNDAKE